MSENFKITWLRDTVVGMLLQIEYLNEKGRTLLFEMFKEFDRFNKNWRYSLNDGHFNVNNIDSSLDDAFALFDEGGGNDYYGIEPLKNTVGISIETEGNPDPENWHPILKRLFDILFDFETYISYEKMFEEMKTSLKTDIDKFNAQFAPKQTVATTRKNVTYKDRKGNTSLMVAAFNHNIKTVKDLIAAGANVNEQNNAGETALFNTIEPIMEILIKAGANVNIQDQYGWTALMNVLQQIQDDDDLLTYENRILMLVQAGADVHKLKDNDGRTAYELCEHDNCKELLKVLAPLPPDMKRFVASGMNYKDIRSLCLVNKEWNRTVCNNQDFYRALLDRGDVFQEQNFKPKPGQMFDDIYSCPDTTIKVYYGVTTMPEFNPSYRMHLESRNDDVENFAKLPGCNNTVTIDNEEYIWYYFMWAPRNNKYTNYSRKYSDDEIMDDLHNDETFRKYFCGRSVHDVERETAVNVGRAPFGLSMKRLQILLFNKGIACVRLPLYGLYHRYLSRGAETVKDADGILNLIENENIQVPDGFISLYDVFNVDHPRYRRFYGTTVASLIARVLRPCTLEDLALEYHRGPSFALTVEMQSLPNLREKQIKYEELLKKYDVIAKFKALMLRLRDGEQTEKIIKIKKGLHPELGRLHNMAKDSKRDKRNRTPREERILMFRYSPILWSNDFRDFIWQIVKSKSLLN